MMQQKPSTKRIVIGLALSLLFGAGFTVLLNNWVAGMGMGFILGTAIDGFVKPGQAGTPTDKT